MKSTRRLLGFTFAVVLLAAATQSARAGHVWLEKAGTFRLLKALQPGDVGALSGNVETKAKCGDGFQQSGDNVTPGLTWPLATGFAWSTIADCSSSVAHADAEAELMFEASAPYLNGGFQYIDTCFDLILDATASPCPNGPSYAWAKGTGDAHVKIGRLTTVTMDDLADLKFRKRTKNVWELNRSHLHITGKETDKDVTTFTDPIILGFLEEETGTIFEDVLMTMGGQVTGYADAIFDFSGDPDSGGILLTAPEDGLSTITFEADFPGAWVTESPGAFGFTLIDGQFTATGVLASAPWVLTYGVGGGVVEAYLAPADVPMLDVEATVDTSGWTLGNTYDGYIDEGIGAETWDSAVPEPTTLGLILVGFSAMWARRPKA